MPDAHSADFQPAWKFWSIFLPGAVLIGIYSVQSLPTGVAHICLQAGIIGIMTFSGLNRSTAARKFCGQSSQTGTRPPWPANGSLHRLDPGARTAIPVPGAGTARERTFLMVSDRSV